MLDEKREVFISYHTDSAGDYVNKIAMALEGAGISCWFAPRNCPPNYAAGIVQAIRECRIFLLVLNEHSNISEHCLNEINVAFERFKNHEDITLIPFRVDKCNLSDEVYYYLGRIHILDGSLPPEVQRIQELLNRISMVLGKQSMLSGMVSEVENSSMSGLQNHQGQSTAIDSSSKQYSLTETLLYPDNNFVGREQEVEEIHRKLTSQKNKAVLVGMGGIGKSEIAKKYLEKYKYDYKICIWITFEKSLEETIASDHRMPIGGLERNDYTKDTDHDYMLRKLRILREVAGSELLLVIDNFDVTEDPDLEEVCKGSYGVLFTSRYHQEANISEIEIGRMQDKEELLGLIAASYKRPISDAEMPLLFELIELLDGHTLSLRLVASTMQARRLNPEKMLGLLKEGRQGIEINNKKAADMIFGSLKQVFSLQNLSEVEHDLMKNLALVPLIGIRVEDFVDWCGFGDFDDIDNLIAANLAILDPVKDEIHLHPLLRQLMEEYLEEDSDCTEGYLLNLYSSCKDDIKRSFADRIRLNEFAQAAYEILPKNSPGRLMAIKSRELLYMSLSLYDKCREVCLEGLSLPDISKEEAARLCERIAHTYALSNMAEETVQYAVKGLSYYEGLDDTKLDRAFGYTLHALRQRMVIGSRQLEKYDDAVYYASLAAEDSQYYYANTPEEAYGWAKYHLSRTYYGKGDLKEAEATIMEARKAFEKINDNWAIANCEELYAQILIDMSTENGDEAIRLNISSWETRQPLIGDEHIDIANNLFWRGRIYRILGRHDEAEICIEKARKIYQDKNQIEFLKQLDDYLAGDAHIVLAY